MSPNDLFLAAILITTPPTATEIIPTSEHWPNLKIAVQTKAIELEILDPREKGYIFHKHEEFIDDMALLRRRYQELKNAPKIVDTFRLPNRKLACDYVQFNRSYRNHLEIRRNIEFDKIDEFKAAIQETESLYQIWDCVRDAQSEFMNIPTRRLALQKLKTLLGEEDYNKVKLPPNIPIWRFSELR